MQEKEQIIYMQTRIVRLASEKWNMEKEDVIELFSKYNVLLYLENNYDIFHIEGDEAILADVSMYLKRKGN